MFDYAAITAVNDLTRTYTAFRAAREAEACTLFVSALRCAGSMTPRVNWRIAATIEWRKDRATIERLERLGNAEIWL